MGGDKLRVRAHIRLLDVLEVLSRKLCRHKLWLYITLEPLGLQR
jgi:hypothetical protein